jgi:hypothetical protein
MIAAGGIGIACVGMLSLIGQLVKDERWYKWGGDVGMAVSTSVCFIVVGAICVALSIRQK